MARAFLVLFLLSTLVNCARNTPVKPVNQAGTGGSSPSVPSPEPTSAPNPPTSSFKWTDKELSENTEACAEAGTSDYSYQSWKTFCRCTYEEAARRWTFSDFTNNFEDRYDALFNDGVIHKCLNKAGIPVE